MTYLSLFLATKLSVAIPILPPLSRDFQSLKRVLDERNTAAAAPLYLLAIILIPIGAAVYIASTRFTDYKHTGFDVLFGSLEGIIAAWFAFRYYHLPIRRGAGWAWGPRRRNAAFGIGMGVGTYGLDHPSMDDQRPGLDPAQSATRRRDNTVVELHDLEPVATAGGSYESQRALV